MPFFSGQVIRLFSYCYYFLLPFNNLRNRVVAIRRWPVALHWRCYHRTLRRRMGIHGRIVASSCRHGNRMDAPISRQIVPELPLLCQANQLPPHPSPQPRMNPQGIDMCSFLESLTSLSWLLGFWDEGYMVLSRQVG